MKQKHMFKWKKDKTTITFKNPEIVFHEKSNEILYFYYDVILKCHEVEKRFRVNDFPKVSYVAEIVDSIISLDKNTEMSLIDNFKSDKFERKIYYNQKLLADGFNIDYFMKFERYEYEISENNDCNKRTWSEYTLLIGQTVNPYDDDTSDCLYIKGLDESDLLKLKSTTEEFVKFALKYNLNHKIDEI
mgnify:CR=1 FL=1